MNGNWKGRERVDHGASLHAPVRRAFARLAPRGQHAVLGREDEGHQEDQRLQADDDAPRRAVEEIAGIGADESW